MAGGRRVYSDLSETELSSSEEELIKAVKMLDASLEKSFAEATEMRRKKINLVNMERDSRMAVKVWNDVRLSPPQTRMEEIQKMVTYKVYSVEKKRVDHMEEKEIDKTLMTVWSDITYLARSSKFGTIIVHYKTEERAIAHMGKKIAKIKVEGIPPEIDAAWVVAALFIEREKEVKVIQAEVMEGTTWKGQIIEITVQAEVEVLEVLPENLWIGDLILKVWVEGRIPRCFKCCQKSHIRVNCPPPPKMVEERQPSPQERIQEVEKETPVLEDREWEIAGKIEKEKKHKFMGTKQTFEVAWRAG